MKPFKGDRKITYKEIMQVDREAYFKCWCFFCSLPYLMTRIGKMMDYKEGAWND